MNIKNGGMKNKKIVTTLLVGAGFFFALCSLPLFASASTNISSGVAQHWAWSDAIGWIDFYTTGNITVSASQLTGYATSSVGYISLDCNTAPGWGCSPTNYKVTNDGAGNLGGWAWNDSIGWTSFYWGNPTSDPTSSSTRTTVCLGYGSFCGVWVDPSGYFHGFAWNDTIGWISFNYVDIGSSYPYSVVSSWAPTPAIGTIDSTTFDTSSTGAQLNSVIWHGSLNGLSPGAVGFQFAVSNTAGGPWTFTGPGGMATTSDVYSGSPNTPIPIYNYSAYSGFRYFRYRLVLKTDNAQSISPQVSGVSVDWSP